MFAKMPFCTHALRQADSGTMKADPQVCFGDPEDVTDLVGSHVFHDTEHKHVGLTRRYTLQADSNHLPQFAHFQLFSGNGLRQDAFFPSTVFVENQRRRIFLFVLPGLLWTTRSGADEIDDFSL